MNDATQQAAGKTVAGTRPSKGAQNPKPTPPRRCASPALPEPVDAFDVLERLDEIGTHWDNLIACALENHRFHDKTHQLPQWAVELLEDQGRRAACRTEFRQQSGLLKEMLHLAAGDGSQYRYEAWTSRGHRLAFRHLSWSDAAKVVDQLKPKFPDAFVTRVHVLSSWSCADNPALLDTLIGRIDHVATSYPQEGEDLFTIRDETGRQVTVPATVLRQHAVYERLDKRGKESLNFYLDEHKPCTERIRAAAKGDAQ